METDIEKSVGEIKAKLIALIKEKKINATQLAQSLNINKNYFTDLKKKKTFSITELALLSENLEYNFFDLVRHKFSSLPASVSVKKARVTVVIEVDNDKDERKILETVLDKSAVKKLIG